MKHLSIQSVQAQGNQPFLLWLDFLKCTLRLSGHPGKGFYFMPFSFLDCLKEWTKPQSSLPELMSLAMVTPLAIYVKEDMNEGSAENLHHPLGNTLDKSVARTVTSFLHFVC